MESNVLVILFISAFNPSFRISVETVRKIAALGMNLLHRTGYTHSSARPSTSCGRVIDQMKTDPNQPPITIDRSPPR